MGFEHMDAPKDDATYYDDHVARAPRILVGGGEGGGGEGGGGEGGGTGGGGEGGGVGGAGGEGGVDGGGGGHTGSTSMHDCGHAESRIRMRWRSTTGE